MLELKEFSFVIITILCMQYQKWATPTNDKDLIYF